MKLYTKSSLKIVGLAALVVVATMGIYAMGAGDTKHDQLRSVCKDELGDGWEYAGYSHAEGWPTYEVKCTRGISLAIWAEQTEWVSVNASAVST